MGQYNAHIRFRIKLYLVAGVAVITLGATLLGGTILGVRQQAQLSNVERRLVPKVDLGPRMEGEFERLTRSFQDAVAAQDAAALDATVAHRQRLVELVRNAGEALAPPIADEIESAIADYYDAALDIARRMLDQEAGTDLTRDTERMQTLQHQAKGLIARATAFEAGELTLAFARIRRSHEQADQLRLGIVLAGLVLVALLSTWVGAGILRTLRDLSEGFQRFANGEFEHRIPETSRDELGEISREANQMAESLKSVALQREEEQWMEVGHAELSEELSGSLEPQEVGRRALRYLVKRLDAAAGVLYLATKEGELALGAQYATEGELSPRSRIARGQDLLGQAFLEDEVVVLEAPPEDHLRIRTSLIECRAQSVVLWPLSHLGRRVGAAEFAFAGPRPPRCANFLQRTCGLVVSALEEATSSSSLKMLLAESRLQAERLAAQEEELRQNNEELRGQREELRQANSELQRRKEVLGAKNDELELAQKRLESKAAELARVSSYKSRFLANMSHELRTPLNSMLLLSHLLSENGNGNLTPKQVEHAETIHSAGDDLLTLINQVLDLSKIESGKQDLLLEEVELQHFVRFTRRTFETAAAQKGIVLSTALDPSLPRTTSTDRNRVERILTNLVGNALKHTQRGEVSLTIGPPTDDFTIAGGELPAPGSIVLAVRDTGSGIAPEQHERIFSPFEQVDGPDQAQPGTGLGLAIARESARLLGGDITVQSELGGGSTFFCVLPIIDMASQQQGAVAPSLSPEGRTFLEAGEPYLLVIEDDPTIAAQILDVCHERGIRAVTTPSGREGLSLARERPPVGIVLDIKLPDVDGWTVMERLRHNVETSAVPVHFISGMDAAQRGFALGAVGYLVKPVTRAQLSTVVFTLTPEADARNVLVIEDDEREARSLTTLLCDEGFTASFVLSAEEALTRLERDKYGCILLDLSLPGMDGLEFLEVLKERPELGAPRVVVHTGRALTRPESRRLEQYAEAIVMKGGNSGERLLDEIRLFLAHVTKHMPAPAGSMVPSADSSLEGLKVLIAEDDMRTVYALSALLQGKGATVLLAENGLEAVKLANQNADLDVVLMDIMMPEMDGYEAIRVLRQDPRFETLPILVLTAKAMRGERERCLGLGASEYMTKPVHPELLVKTLLRHTRAGSVDD
jgi:hypothetical protein